MIILRDKFFSRKNIKYKGEKQTPYNNAKVKQKITVADILKKKNANIANTAAAPVTPKQLPIVAQKQLPAIVEKPKVNPKQLPAIVEKPKVNPKQLPAIVEKPKVNPKQLPATIEKPKVNPLPPQSPTPVPKKVPTPMPNIVKGSGIGDSILGKVGKFTRKNKVALTVGGLAAYGLGINHLMNGNNDN